MHYVALQHYGPLVRKDKVCNRSQSWKNSHILKLAELIGVSLKRSKSGCAILLGMLAETK